MTGLEAEAAVDGEDLAGDEVGAGGEEEDGIGDVGGGAVALHRSAAGEVLKLGIDFAVDDHAGGDAVDADLGRPGFGHGAREHVEGSFGGAVMGVRGPGVEAAQRSYINDAAVSGFEMRVSSLGGEEGRAGVGVEHGVPLLDGEALEGGGFVAAGVVDEDVEAGEAGDGGVDGGADLGRIAELRAKGSGLNAQIFDVGNGLKGFGFGVAPGNGDGSSGFSEGEGEGTPDTFCSAGNEGDLTIERARVHDRILNPGCGQPS